MVPVTTGIKFFLLFKTLDHIYAISMNYIQLTCNRFIENLHIFMQSILLI